MKKYLTGTVILSLLLIGVYFFNDIIVFNWPLHDQFMSLVVFFFLQSLVVGWLFRQAELEDWKNPIYILGAVSFRLLTAMFYLVVLYVMKMEEMKMLMIQFISLYLLYLIFELFAVLPNLRRN